MKTKKEIREQIKYWRENGIGEYKEGVIDALKWAMAKAEVKT